MLDRLPTTPAPIAGELLRTTPRAYEPVAHELLVLILGGHLAVGDRLPSERQLAARFGVSRTTVREALAALEARGLVVTRVGSGTFVAGREASEQDAVSSDDSPSEVMEARLVLEVAIARLAARRAPLAAEALERVRATVEALERTATPEVLPDGLDRDFHRSIAQLTGNEYLAGLVEPLWDTIEQALYTTLRTRNWTVEHTERTAKEHRAIYEALRAGDVELAAFATERHLRGLMAVLFEDDAVDGPPPRFFA